MDEAPDVPTKDTVNTLQKISPLFILFISIVFLLVGIAIGYALALYVPSSDLLSPKVETSITSPTVIQTTPSTGGNVITTERYRITIPNDWVATEDVVGIYQAPDGSTLSVTVFESDTDSLKTYLANLDKLTSTSWEGKPAVKVIDTKEVTVIGLPAIQRVEELLAADFTTIHTYLLINRQVYSFSIIPLEIPYTQTDVYSRYEEVINTLEPVGSYTP